MVRRVLSGNAEQKDRMKMKQSDRQRTPGGQPFAASGNERKKGADFSALTLRMDRIPDGFQCRFRQETDRCLPEITATGEKLVFDSVELVFQLSAFPAPESCMTDGSGCMGDGLHRFRCRPEEEIKAADWMILRFEERSFLIVGLMSWNVFSAVLHWSGSRLSVQFYGDGKRFEPGETRALESVFYQFADTEEACLDAYFSAIAACQKRRPLERDFRGWGSWDYYSTGFSAKTLQENLREVKALSPDVNLIQIDDGYCVWGDWMDINPAVFPDTLPVAVRALKEQGVEVGIWFAPFLAHTASRVVREHPEWFLWTPDGALRRYFVDYAVLDLSLDEPLDYIRRSVRFFLEAGITYFKADFLKAGVVSGASANNQTPYERFHRCLSAIREEIGESGYLLGCSAAFFPCVGHVDAMRVGPDVMPNFQGIRNSAKGCVASFAANRKLYRCDVDYLVVRGEGMEDAERTSPSKIGTLTQNEAEMWCNFVELSGGPVISSDKIACLTPARRELLARTLRAPAEHGNCRILDYWCGGSDQIASMLLSPSGRLGLFNWEEEERTFSPGGRRVTLPPHTSVILDSFSWNGERYETPVPDSPVRQWYGEAFRETAPVRTFPLGAAARKFLRPDHVDGMSILYGVYEPLIGARTLAGIPFRIDETALALTRESPECEIPVHAALSRLYFLHAADWPVKGEFLTCVLRDEQGNETGYPVVLGREIGNSDIRYSLPWNSSVARVAWIEPEDCRTLYVWRLEIGEVRNIASIRFTSFRQKGEYLLAGLSGC